MISNNSPQSPVPSPQSLSYSLYTLGCKLNQLESEAIADAFGKAGFTLVSGSAVPTARPGLIIINTCTVTSKADQKARRLIRKALRENPEACVMVTGCYAALDPADITLLEQEAGGTGGRRLFIVGGGDSSAAAKSALLDLPGYILDAMHMHGSLPHIVESWMACAKGDSPFGFKPETLTFHSRGYLKIQDGCDNSCAYCRVRLARGQSISLPKESALAQLRAFAERGCAELMITGVNITQYRDSGFGLAELLDYLLEQSTGIALRLASLEPEGIDDKLASVLANPRIRPHFHLSVQSGSDTVLRAMGRVYTAQTVEQGAALLRSVKDNPFLACDIIAGFPGETDADFARTAALCEQTGFAWIHAFPYSKRPGTAAFSLGNSVCERDVTQRVKTLTDLALRGRQAYTQAWLGRELSAIVEKGSPHTGRRRAVSENYLKLLIQCPDDLPPGSVIRCIPVSLCPAAGDDGPDALAALV
ncbi:MAG: tRNA (N(6)-L-threonylcarbamoyladenosine(37)-C(2))-methylthiotransferase MtaB [Treponema sp.]|nr:tRNA (N(6)-L-threonylcarbamoyladenosine(37)-C(2))-methylthiotransferase MtaB [Treponema sp.]